MVPFKPYFTGEETPPYLRATSVQKCVRAGGKHNDLDDIGRTNRHFSFFEMLGNFSFGDYFKREAIQFAWDFYSQVVQLDTGRLWVTVYEEDDEAEQIWRNEIGFPADRIQRLGEDNFWRMADTGPCGPSSEIFWDIDPSLGAEGELESDRYVEIWNLVFMQFDQHDDGTRSLLPKPSIDTGAGLERNLMVVQDTKSIFDIDLFVPLLAEAQRATGARYGGDERVDISLRIIAEHARTMSFMVSDGVRPSNQERGYVLRRIIRRAVRHAYLLGARDVVLPGMIDAVVATMDSAYPEIVNAHDVVRKVVQREEEAFRATLQRGVDLLDGIVERGDVSGEDAFFLHDTLGFPIDLTREIAGERGRAVDFEGFDERMREQQARGRAGAADAKARGAQTLIDEAPTEFTGRQESVSSGTVIALLRGDERVTEASEGDELEVVLDRTPFYAESGGQIGDTGTITTAPGAVLDVTDTQYRGQVVVHRARVRSGDVGEGDEVMSSIDAVRRDRIRRNHTATHILHWALREVLGSHVQQAGSLVAPDRLRFDFSHHEPVTPEQLAEVERLANAQVISDAPVRHYETTKAEAERIGAIAFFGEKYGDIVRVLEAGPSTELCGGTHVDALGFIGPIKIVSEGSIGSNLRRIEAMTGDGAFEYIEFEEQLLRRAGDLLRASPREVPDKIERLAEQVRDLQSELDQLKTKAATRAASDLAASAVGGVLVARRDGLAGNDLRQLAIETVRAMGSGVAGLVGATDGKAALAVAVSADLVERGAMADAIAKPAAQRLGGNVGRGDKVVVGGGKNVDAVDGALELLHEQADPWRS
jgi:alanyl-tRNA synthetase